MCVNFFKQPRIKYSTYLKPIFVELCFCSFFSFLKSSRIFSEIWKLQLYFLKLKPNAHMRICKYLRNRLILYKYPKFQKRQLFLIFLKSVIFICTIQPETTFYIVFSFWRKYQSTYKYWGLDCRTNKKLRKKMHRCPEHRINA